MFSKLEAEDQMKMLIRQNQAKLVFLVIICCFCCSFLTIFYILSNHANLNCNCANEQDSSSLINQNLKAEKNQEVINGHKLCILVPFRDRFEELMEFAPYMNKFLSDQNVDHEIYVMHQADKYRC